MVSESDLTGWTISLRSGYTSMQKNFYDSNQSGPTYQSYTSIPDSLDTTILEYTDAAVVNNKLFVSGCYTDFFDDATKMIFASLPNRFDTFNLLTDFVRTDFTPVALAGFGGKLLVIGTNKLARVNPEGLYIEDESLGNGIHSSESFVITDYGIFWCDMNGAYYNDSRQTKVISDNIHGKSSSNYKEWADLITHAEDRIKVLYSVEKRGIIYLNSTTGKAWFYHLMDGAWYYWDLYDGIGNYSNLGTYTVGDTHAFMGKDNLIYVTTMINGVYSWIKLFNGTLYLPWEWTSLEFNLGQASQNKKFYKLWLIGNTVHTNLFFGINGGVTSSSPNSDSTIPITYLIGKSIQFFIQKTISDTTNYFVENINLLFRKMHIH